MNKDLKKMIYRLAFKTRVLKSMIESDEENLSEREIMILDLLKYNKSMSITEISSNFKNLAISTISADISKLWKENEYVEKKVDPSNERVRLVELTDKGDEKLKDIVKKRFIMFEAIIDALDLNTVEEEIFIKALERALPSMDSTIEEYKSKTI